MKAAEFHPEAEAELAEAVAFYDAEDPSLGSGFAEAVETAVQFVRENPEAGPPVRRIAALAGAPLPVFDHLS